MFNNGKKYTSFLFGRESFFSQTCDRCQYDQHFQFTCTVEQTPVLQIRKLLYGCKGVIEAEIQGAAKSKFLIDGFPRAQEQIEAFEARVNERASKLAC